jgi:hypothetical protein
MSHRYLIDLRLHFHDGIHEVCRSMYMALGQLKHVLVIATHTSIQHYTELMGCYGHTYHFCENGQVMSK